MKEFFGIDGYQRAPEGFLSWQHIVFVTVFMIAMVVSAVLLGRRNRDRSEREKNLVMIVTAIAIDAVELGRVVFLCFREHNPMQWLYNLPLFLCSIPMIAIPLAAFTKGRVREASLDFVFIFGFLIAFMGTYGAGNNFGTYPVLCFDNVVSAITHSLAGFAALYAVVARMVKLDRRNIPISYAILCTFCLLAYIADRLIPYNYMFLMNHDGTPYSIFYNMVNGHPVLYPLIVVFLFLVYIAVFYLVCYLIKRGKRRRTEAGDNTSPN